MGDTYEVGDRTIDIDNPDDMRSLTSAELAEIFRQAGEDPEQHDETDPIIPLVQQPKGTSFAWFSTPRSSETE